MDTASFKIIISIPYALDKNLGRAYNEAAAMVPENDWICCRDYDCNFLTPDAISIMNEYVRLYPDTGLFTTFTNRLHPLAADQLLNGTVSEDFNMRNHIKLAENQRAQFPSVTKLDHPILGFLMSFSKKTWNAIKFDESGLCLGVDNLFSAAILQAGMKIRRMDALYLWHSYRTHNIKDKSHLLNASP